jgi:hypothetical protein
MAQAWLFVLTVLNSQKNVAEKRLEDFFVGTVRRH